MASEQQVIFVRRQVVGFPPGEPVRIFDYSACVFHGMKKRGQESTNAE
jgi:hypothetical protein